MTSQRKAIETLILTLVEQRGPGKTICPSEVARAIDPEDWRPLMAAVRAVAASMAADGRVQVTQRGEVVDINTARGPVRLGPTA